MQTLSRDDWRTIARRWRVFALVGWLLFGIVAVLDLLAKPPLECKPIALSVVPGDTVDGDKSVGMAKRP